MLSPLFRCCLAAFLVSFALMSSADDPLRDRLGDDNGTLADVWVYNDIDQATERARKENKPLFVTFRCVPCQACAAFDADVAKASNRVRALARDKFVAVRQVEMKGVDLSQFEFDHDLNWAAMFINADGTVYARYGTQSAEGPDAYNSIDGLLATMQRVLDLHADYPNNIDELRGKRGTKEPGTTALELPGMENAEKLELETTRSNCIHCHMIHDAAHFHAQRRGTFSHDMLWKFPLPEAIGLSMDRTSSVKIAEVENASAAASAGLRAGDEIGLLGGQRITSIADIQWVLHKLPNTDTSLELETITGAKHTLTMAAGWKEHDASWRGSIWSVSPRLRVWVPELPNDRRKELEIPESEAALLVKWINNGSPGGRAAQQAGLRHGDVIVGLAGEPLPKMSPQQFNMHVKLNYEVGDQLPITVIRDGKRRDLAIELVE